MPGVRGPVPAALTIPLLALVALMVAPDAVAQAPHEPELEFAAKVTPHPDPITPIYENGTARITLEVTCQPPGKTISPIPLNLRVENNKPDISSVILSSKVVFVAYETEECLATPATREFNLEVDISFNTQAHAFTDTGFRLFVSHDDQEQLVTEWKQEIGFFERWKARYDQRILQSVLKEPIKISGTIENHGNGPIQVDLKAEKGPELGQIVLPPPQSVGTGEMDGIKPFRIDYRGDDTGRDSIAIRFEGTSLDDPSIELDPTTKRFVVQVEWDPFGRAPTITPVLAIATLIGIVLAIRRTPPA